LANAKSAAVHAKHIDNVVFQNMHVSDAGMHGIYAEGYVKQCTFQNNLIEKVGAQGLFLEGNCPGEGDVNGNNTIFNIKIRNFGELTGDSAAIDLFQSSNNTASHLDIANGPRRAVWVHGGFNDSTEQIYAYGNTLTYGKVAHCMQDSGDAGALALSFISGNSGSRVNVNTFNQWTVDSIAADPSMNDYLPAGVMNDNESNAQVYQNIWVTNTPGYLYRANTSSPGTATNCSFLLDGSANPDFDSSLIDLANIGTTSAFPY
jgi:hypothetical protein